MHVRLCSAFKTAGWAPLTQSLMEQVQEGPEMLCHREVSGILLLQRRLPLKSHFPKVSAKIPHTCLPRPYSPLKITLKTSLLLR